MDQVGFVVTGYEKGYLRFGSLGGVDARLLPAAELTVLTPIPMPAVVDVMPPHALSKEDSDQSLPLDKLYLDVGLTEQETMERIPLGTPVVYNTPVLNLAGGCLCGPALDDKSCAAIVLKVFEELKDDRLPFDLYALFSVQEEVGTRGAVPGTYAIAPDYAIVLDVTFGEQPDVPDYKTLKMGGGAAIGLGPNVNRRFSEALGAFAKENGLPCQWEVMPGNSGTDAWPIQVSRFGVATAIVSLPLRYMHSPAELIRISDADNIIKLLTGFLRQAGEVL